MNVKKLFRCILCSFLILSFMSLTGCKKDDEEIRDELSAAIEKTKEASSYQVKQTSSFDEEYVYTLENNKEVKETSDSTSKVSAKYYVKDDKKNYYEENINSDGSEYITIVKNDQGASFYKEENQDSYASDRNDTSDYSSLIPASQFLYETWLEDINEYASYNESEEDGEIEISINIDDFEGLDEAETQSYYKDYGAEIKFTNFDLVFIINEDGYITSVDADYDYTLTTTYEEPTDLGYKSDVVKSVETSCGKNKVTFSKFNEDLTIDFSLFDKFNK